VRVAVWRYGMALQTGDSSTVGGGYLSHRVLKRIADLGHEVHVVGPVAKGSREGSIQYVETKDLRRYDAVVILTGPFNPLYGDAAFDTYRRLATFEGPVAYAQWDVALPFHFGAMSSPRVAQLARVQTEDVFRNKRWFVLAQTRGEDLRAMKSKSVGYSTAPFERVGCLFELEQMEQAELPVAKKVTSAVGYFGSDRPGRMAEFARWFVSDKSPASHLYGRWSAKSLKEMHDARGLDLACEYRGMVTETSVVSTLNKYATTMYLADPQYVKTDFIAQRFFENVTAGVPVLYSDKLQPSVKATIPRDLVCSTMDDFVAKVDMVTKLSHKQRVRMVDEHRAAVRQFATMRVDNVATALEKVLQ